jgi:CYTH domain-containing protein
MEIERKFLVDTLPADLDRHPASALEQGYLAIHADGTEARIRRRDGASILTVKSGGGLVRVEEELPIDDGVFERLWPLTEGRRIEKVRHLIPAEPPAQVIELDVYCGDLDGLVVAEIEFATEADADAFVPPAWLGPDVTGDARFKNQRLALDGRPEPTPAA